MYNVRTIAKKAMVAMVPGMEPVYPVRADLVDWRSRKLRMLRKAMFIGSKDQN